MTYDVYTYPYTKYRECETCSGKKGKTYLNIPCAFDIETTNKIYHKDDNTIDSDKSFGFMYHWQFAIYNDVCFGRTWEEFITFINKLKKALFLDNSRFLVIYVHNLAFEFQFMKDFFKWNSVFAREKRKPMKAVTEGLEFRCSYILSNMSLSAFCEKTPNVKHGKLVDKYDYSKLRTPNTPLTDIEKEYCYNDVVGLTECIDFYIEEDGDISKIPLTSTGYVRREFRQAVQKNPVNGKIMKNIALNDKTYELCRKAFRGGDTHCNLEFVNELLADVNSKDKSSSYPFSMLTKKFPMSKFVEVVPRDLKEFKFFVENYACIFEVSFTNINVKKFGQFTYIPVAKCWNRKNVINDNGRVLKAELITTALTDIDFKIIEKEYNYTSFFVKNMYIAKYDYLPIEFREKLFEYYRRKCELKGGNEYFYMKMKNRVNSSYGMMVTDIIQSDIQYVDNEWKEVERDLQTSLKTYYKNRNSFLSYQHGIFVTAHSRYELRKGIWAVGNDGVYVDTDSVKYLGEHEEDFSNLNEEILNDIQKLDLIPQCTVNGVTYTCGVWEDDGFYTQFKTLGAKKYCFEKEKNGEKKITVTVSGLNKRKGSKALTEKGGVSAFNIGLKFNEKESGRTVACYHDEPPHTITVDGCTFTTASNIAIANTTYVLGVTNEFASLFI